MHRQRQAVSRFVVLAAIVALLAGSARAAAPAAVKPAAAPKPALEEGFVSLFNGKDLSGWDGDPRLWSVRDGAIRGETTAEKPARGNTFCVWRGGKLKDFILKIKFRIAGGNSGVQYRSKEVDRWRISGYQAEVCNGGSVGFLYHERGRGGLVGVGDFVEINPGADGKVDKKVVGKVADRKTLARGGYYKPDEWNEYTIIAQGNYLRHYLNGLPTVALIDNDRTTDPKDPRDTRGRALEGVLALQIHAGAPMVVEFKDIRLKALQAKYAPVAVRLFNGEDLAGWTTSSDGCKDTFAVRGGVITDTGRPAGYLRTEKDYASYTLHLQMRHVKPGNSGVLVRMVGRDKVWPKSIEAQGQSGSMGDIWNIDRFGMKAVPERTRGRHTRKAHRSNERAIGEWNDYEITLDGGDLEIRVNNLVQNTATECDEVAGKICLQAEGSPKEFRNIVLVPIARGGPAPAAVGRAKVAAARVSIAQIEVAVDTFEVDCGRYPTTEEGLGALLRPPAGLAEWKGPYLKRMPTDPWGNPYVYLRPGRHNPNGYDVHSRGSDGRDGGGDDITNWEAPDGDVLFEDHFEGKPAAGWSWLSEDPKAWRIQDNALEILVQPGVATTVKNALVRDAPDRRKGTHAIDVTVTNHTMPTRQYEQAGITWYSNGRPVFKLVKELIKGKLYIIPGRKPMPAKTVQLRLIVTAGEWTAQYRPGGKGEFLTAAKGKLPPPGRDQVSIQCYNGPTDAEHWIRFDDFRITKLPG